MLFFLQCLTLLVGWQKGHPAFKSDISKPQRFFFEWHLGTWPNVGWSAERLVKQTPKVVIVLLLLLLLSYYSG